MPDDYQSIVVTAHSEQADTLKSVWVKHVKCVDVSKPGAFSLGGDFVGSNKSHCEKSLRLVAHNIPKTLALGEALVFGATFTPTDFASPAVSLQPSKIAIVFTAQKSSTSHSPFGISVARSGSKYIHAVNSGSEQECMLSVQLSALCRTFYRSLDDMYNGDVFSVSTLQPFQKDNSCWASTSPFNAVAVALKQSYGVAQSDLTEQFQEATYKPRGALAPLVHHESIGTVGANDVVDVSANRRLIRHNNRKLRLPVGYKAVQNVKKGLTLLKDEKTGDVAFFDILANDVEFTSNETWESYLEEQARVLESIAMAYRIIAQIKDKKPNKKEINHD